MSQETRPTIDFEKAAAHYTELARQAKEWKEAQCFYPPKPAPPAPDK